MVVVPLKFRAKSAHGDTVLDHAKVILAADRQKRGTVRRLENEARMATDEEGCILVV